jgi:hypothetical protein
MRKEFWRAALVCGVTLAAGLWSVQANAGSVVSYRVLHAFCKTATCNDGTLPASAPTIDANGNLFGVTAAGGRFGGGVLYELFPKHGGALYFKHVLKMFCDPETDCDSGGEPQAPPIMDALGNLYGTTSSYIQSTCGAVYMKSARTQLYVLHVFQGTDGCHAGPGSLVYQGSASGQAYDGVSPLYGMTVDGGSNSSGTVYELTPPKPGRKKWSERVIYSFCHISDCADGVHPGGNLVMDASGNLFGGTADGLIFALSPNGSGGFDYHAIHVSATGESYTGLVLASDGTTLFGVASKGGGSPAAGTLFRFASGSQYTLLHTFCSGGGTCVDGNGPTDIVLDSQGNIFGMTASGGANPAPPGVPATGAGTVFEYTHAGSFLTLYNFCAQANCADGGNPVGGLTMNNGALYGTTGFGGSTANSTAGVAFELRP